MIISQFWVDVSVNRSAGQTNGFFAMHLTNLESVSLELQIRFVATVRETNMDITPFLDRNSKVLVEREDVPLTWSKQGHRYTGEFSIKVPPLEIVRPSLYFTHLLPELAATTPELKAVFEIDRLFGHWEVSLPMKTVRRGGKSMQVPQLNRRARFLISAETSYEWYDLDIPMSDVFIRPATLAEGKAEHWIQPAGTPSE